MLKAFRWLDSKYSWFASRSGGLLVGLMILFLMCINLGEIILRNAGNPTVWTSELSTIMMLWVFLLPLVFTQMSGGMIRITILTSRMPLKIRPWIDLLGSFSAILFGILLFVASLRFLQTAVPGGYFMGTHFPVGVQRGLVPVFASLLIIAGILCFVREILDIRGYKGSPDRNG